MRSVNTGSAGDRESTRRSFLKLAGTGAVFTTGLAGCIGGEDGASPTPTAMDDDTPTDGGAATGTPSPSGPDTAVIGQPGSLTGQWDFLQPAVSQSTDLATQEINEAGGPLGAEFEINRRDTAVDPQQARQVVRQLVNSDQVAAITGLFSSEIVPLWDFIQDQEVPIVSPWPGTTFLDTRGGDKATEDLSDDEWLWRTVIGDTVHTAGAATAMVENDFTTMGVLSATTAGEEGWTKQFVNWYESLGGEVVEVVSAEAGKSTYQSELNRLFENDFDAWGLSFALEDATTIIRNWDEGGYGRQLLLEDGLMSGDLISAVGDQAEGAWIAAGSTQGPNYDAFEPKYREFGEAEIHPWGVAAYDATNVLALAIHLAGEASHDAIQRSIGSVTREGGTTVSTFADGKAALDAGDQINYEGAVTNVDFTSHGNVWGDVAVSTVTPDDFETAFTIGADTLQERIDAY